MTQVTVDIGSEQRIWGNHTCKNQSRKHSARASFPPFPLYRHAFLVQNDLGRFRNRWTPTKVQWQFLFPSLDHIVSILQTPDEHINQFGGNFTNGIAFLRNLICLGPLQGLTHSIVKFTDFNSRQPRWNHSLNRLLQLFLLFVRELTCVAAQRNSKPRKGELQTSDRLANYKVTDLETLQGDWGDHQPWLFHSQKVPISLTLRHAPRKSDVSFADTTLSYRQTSWILNLFTQWCQNSYDTTYSNHFIRWAIFVLLAYLEEYLLTSEPSTTPLVHCLGINTEQLMLLRNRKRLEKIKLHEPQYSSSVDHHLPPKRKG